MNHGTGHIVRSTYSSSKNHIFLVVLSDEGKRQGGAGDNPVHIQSHAWSVVAWARWSQPVLLHAQTHFLRWCHTPSSPLTRSSSSDSLQGERQLGCEACIGLQRSAEEDSIVHRHFLYLSLGKSVALAGWKCFTDEFARAHALGPGPVGMPLLACRWPSYCSNCNLWPSLQTEAARRELLHPRNAETRGRAPEAGLCDFIRTWLLPHTVVAFGERKLLLS